MVGGALDHVTSRMHHPRQALEAETLVQTTKPERPQRRSVAQKLRGGDRWHRWHEQRGKVGWWRTVAWRERFGSIFTAREPPQWILH